MTQQKSGASAITLGALFVGFLEIALASFGGALAWARRILVERRRWFSDREFAEVLGLCQVLPGGNVLNLAVYVGARAHGLLGAVVALAGLLLPPLFVVTLLGEVYAQGAELEIVRTAVRGAAPVAVGLLLATGLKLTAVYRRQPWALTLVALAFAAVGLLGLPMIPVLFVLGPIGIAIAWRRGR